MKFSKQRNLILDTVVSNPIHPTADQVYSAVKQIDPNISLGTVYRNLNLLAENGMLKKICISYGSDRFDGRTDTHFHMICDKCARVYDVELEELANIKQNILKNTGFTVTEYELTIQGICPDCK